MALQKNLMGLGMAGSLAAVEGFVNNSVTGVGTSQGGSSPTLEPQSINQLTTAGGATACTLPSPALGSKVGDTIHVYTITSTSGLVFPDTGSQVDLGTATTGSVSIAQNRGRIFTRVSPTQWKSIYGS